LQQNLAKAFSGGGDNDLAEDESGNKFANNIAVTTNKTAFNNPKGAKIETINQGSNVQGFEPFYMTNANIICAAIGIPPNVAMSVYNDSFSASRAATKDWDHTMDVEREDFTNQFYKHIYKFWLYTEILKNKIQAPGYVSAIFSKNFMVTESYEKMRFTGPHFPHIDPLKEVKAEREKLGALGKNMPLTTLELATESLGGGDSDSNIEQFADELANVENRNLIERPKPIDKPTETKPV
jgi:capsid protein